MENPFSDSNRYLTNRVSPTTNPPLSEMIFGHRLSKLSGSGHRLSHISENEEQQPWPLPDTIDGTEALHATPPTRFSNAQGMDAEVTGPLVNEEKGVRNQKKTAVPQKFIIWYPRLHPAFLGLAGLICIVILLVALLVHFEVSKHSGAKHKDQAQATTPISSVSTTSSASASSPSGGTEIVATTTTSAQSETAGLDIVTTYTNRQSTVISSGTTHVFTTKMIGTTESIVTSSGFTTILVQQTDTTEVFATPRKTSTTMYVETAPPDEIPSTMISSGTEIATVTPSVSESLSSSSVSMIEWTATTIIESPTRLAFAGASSDASRTTAAPASLSPVGVHNLIDASLTSTTCRTSWTISLMSTGESSAATASSTGVATTQATTAQSPTESPSTATSAAQTTTTQMTTQSLFSSPSSRASPATSASSPIAEVHNLIEALKGSWAKTSTLSAVIAGTHSPVGSTSSTATSGNPGLSTAGARKLISVPQALNAAIPIYSKRAER